MGIASLMLARIRIGRRRGGVGDCIGLEPDPGTAPHVRWMFAQRRAGVSIAGIARALNDRQVPCPSVLDPGRNPRRCGQGWRVPTVTSILSNPRYTGRQVWNRQHTRRGTGEEDPSLQGWSSPQQWVISSRPTHAALVSEADFVAVQHMRATRGAVSGSARVYLLAGLVRCGLCRRRMDSHWAHRRPGYRCRHGIPAPGTARRVSRRTSMSAKTTC
ncbi:recombinase family protein [Saccharopolyspora sp. SCSIO 74807]|uniref:recombinase family protein n=1 Tax=Saccharopolyspora sp. SCSIO 74807 TaxID=3118084 RepID=UPI0030D2EB34